LREKISKKNFANFAPFRANLSIASLGDEKISVKNHLI